MKPAHLRAQAALVRMIYDPAFAAAVVARPDEVLPALPAALRRALGAVDPRALRRDRDRRERTLGQLCEELPSATTLAVAETGRVETLLGFYGSAAFHEAIDADLPLVPALAAYLEGLFADGTLRSPHAAAILALEAASARARRSIDVAAPPGRLRRAAGVEPVEVPDGALAALQAVERHRFRLALLPAWAVAREAPSPTLPALGSGRMTLAAIALDGAVSLVEIERPLHAVLRALDAPRKRAAVVDEAALRLGGDRAAAEAALASLVEDELVLTS